MIRNTVLVTRSYYYPLGNTPAVSLTQDLPPEQDADILLLGCGDARNILFTCFADAARKIDVTCCDIEPGIHARNIVLYSLLIEDEENRNIESIWNIYYHWKLDEKSMELLETQIQKLLEVSESIDQWHTSAYGSYIRFCDERSLSLVRSYWTGYQLRGLSDSEKAIRQDQMQTALDRAQTLHEKMAKKAVFFSDLRSTCPYFDPTIITDLPKVSQQWWNNGAVPSNGGIAQKCTKLNPAFLYSQNKTLTLHYGLSPLSGFPLSTAYIPITKGSPFHCQRKDTASTEHLVNCAKNHFTQWASAFRKAMENKSVIRIFCGDALAFGLTLRHCQLALPEGSTSMNLFSDNYTNTPLKLHNDYGKRKNAAPLWFDIIDTSNLVDHLGPLNVIGIGSSLLKCSSSCSLYTEKLVQQDLNFKDRLIGLFGVDARCMSLLFGLVLPDLFTNATDSFGNDLIMDKVNKQIGGDKKWTSQVRSRLRWKRSPCCQESSTSHCVQVEAKKLAKLLIQVHDVMFEYEDVTKLLNSLMLDDPLALSKQANLHYNRLSFAFLLSLLRATVATDWGQCVEVIYDTCLRFKYRQDLMLQMHLCGIRTLKLSVADVRDAVLAPILPFRENEDVPEQVCVTIRVAREKLRIFTEREVEDVGTPALTCMFEGDAGGKQFLEIFSAVQVTFGKWHEETKEGRSFPFIKEDSSQLWGTSDMFVSVYVPTLMLLQSKSSVPWVMCCLIQTQQNRYVFLKDLGPHLFVTRSEMTSKDIFITRYMPGMPALPAFPLVSALQDQLTSPRTTVRLTQDGLEVDTLIQRVSLANPKAKAKLAIKSATEKIDFTSPLTALFHFGQSEELKFEFPIPVSPSKCKIRIARKSSYIEVETPLFDPLKEDAASFMYPTLFTKTSSGATIPMSWAYSRIDLDAMPQIDLKDLDAVSWLNPHISQMFSVREARIRHSSSGAEVDLRTDLKDGLFSIFIHFTGLQGQKHEFFGLNKPAQETTDTILLPSCLRLDLVNHTVVLDAAMIVLTKTVASDLRVMQFLQELFMGGLLCSIKVSQDENRAWKALFPALVERCRTAKSWKHGPRCEYIKAGEVPLTKGLSEDFTSTVCSCGLGKFPPGNYLESQMKKFPDLKYIVDRYATRVALGPFFPVPYVED